MVVATKYVSLLILSLALPPTLYWTCIAGQNSGLKQALGTDSRRNSRVASSSNGPPELTVLLTPLFAADNITSVHVSMSFEPRPELKATSGLFQGATTAASIPALDIEEGSLRVFDAAGSLEVTPHDVALNGHFVGYRWMTDRPTEGSVNISYVALPRSVSNTERNGPVLDFRLESGGLLASGFSLLVAPVDLEEKYDVFLDWNLSRAPIGTKGVWAWGPSSEGPIVRRMTAFEILWIFLAAGPVQAYIDEDQAGAPARFNVYWRGELPFDGDELSGQIGQLFHDMSDFFDDDGESYRVFLRHNPYPGTNSGTALQRSFMFCYDDSDYLHPGGTLDRVMVIAHEMVHNWVIWDSSVDFSVHGWYPEGFAEYYSILLLHRSGLMNSEEYVKRVNGWLLAYYTSEYSYMSLDDANRDMWRSSAGQKVPYRRGHAFGMQLDATIRAATKSRASLDDLVLRLVRLNKSGQSSGPKEFNTILGDLLGSEERALDLVNNMKSGTHLVVPPIDALSAGRFNLPTTLRRHDVEQFQLRFDAYTARMGLRIAKLVPGSRAEAAGLREGDHVRGFTGPHGTDANYSSTLKFQICHENESEWQQVEVWPRAMLKVENWSFDLLVETEL